LVVVSANYVIAANRAAGMPDSNFPAAIGQPTNWIWQVAASGGVGARKGSAGAPSGDRLPSGGSSSGGQGGSSSGGQDGGASPGLGMDAPGGPKWTPPTKVEAPSNPSDSGDLPGDPPWTPGGGR